MLFVHFKRILKLDRMPLRGMSGATGEFTLAGAAQNLRRQVDNRNLSALFGYRLGGHRFSLGYMHSTGDTATPYISGTELMGMSELTMSSDFLNAKERTWQAIYDYDFAAAGVPGFKSRLRYVRGDNIELAAFNAKDRKEREFQMELAAQPFAMKTRPASWCSTPCRSGKRRSMSGCQS